MGWKRMKRYRGLHEPPQVIGYKHKPSGRFVERIEDTMIPVFIRLRGISVSMLQELPFPRQTSTMEAAALPALDQEALPMTRVYEVQHLPFHAPDKDSNTSDADLAHLFHHSPDCKLIVSYRNIKGCVIPVIECASILARNVWERITGQALAVDNPYTLINNISLRERTRIMQCPMRLQDSDGITSTLIVCNHTICMTVYKLDDNRSIVHVHETDSTANHIDTNYPSEHGDEGSQTPTASNAHGIHGPPVDDADQLFSTFVTPTFVIAHGDMLAADAASVTNLPRADENCAARRYYIEQYQDVLQQRHRSGPAAVEQLKAYDLRSWRDERRVLCFFETMHRDDFPLDIRMRAMRPDKRVREVYVFGVEHLRYRDQLRNFYRKYLYCGAADDFFDKFFGHDAMTMMLVIDQDILGAVTMRRARTRVGDPVYYVSLIAQSDEATFEDMMLDTRPSKFMINDLFSFVCATVPVGGTVHILLQSVGYGYRFRKNRMHPYQTNNGVAGRKYWAKHLTHNEASICFLAQLSYMPGFVEGCCLAKHTQHRRIGVLSDAAQGNR